MTTNAQYVVFKECDSAPVIPAVTALDALEAALWMAERGTGDCIIVRNDNTREVLLDGYVHRV